MGNAENWVYLGDIRAQAALFIKNYWQLLMRHRNIVTLDATFCFAHWQVLVLLLAWWFSSVDYNEESNS